MKYDSQGGTGKMNVRQKFIALAGIAGAIMAIVSVVGYFTASNSLEATVEEELVSEIGRQSAQADGWLAEKAKYGEGVASILKRLTAAENSIARSRQITMAVADDKDVKNLLNVMEDGFCMTMESGDKTGASDWNKRDW